MHPNPSQFKINPLKPPKMVKFPASCAQAVGLLLKINNHSPFFRKKRL